MTAADFFFADEQLSLVTCDEEGIIRMYEYDPQSKRANGLTFPFPRALPLLVSFLSLSPSKVPSRTKDKHYYVEQNSMASRIIVPP